MPNWCFASEILCLFFLHGHWVRNPLFLKNIRSLWNAFNSDPSEDSCCPVHRLTTLSQLCRKGMPPVPDKSLSIQLDNLIFLLVTCLFSSETFYITCSLIPGIGAALFPVLERKIQKHGRG